MVICAVATPPWINVVSDLVCGRADGCAWAVLPIFSPGSLRRAAARLRNSSHDVPIVFPLLSQGYLWGARRNGGAVVRQEEDTPTGGALEQAALQGEAGRGGARCHPQLAIERGDMMVDGAQTDHQLVRDLRVGQALGEQTQHV